MERAAMIARAQPLSPQHTRAPVSVGGEGDELVTTVAEAVGGEYAGYSHHTNTVEAFMSDLTDCSVIGADGEAVAMAVADPRLPLAVLRPTPYQDEEVNADDHPRDEHSYDALEKYSFPPDEPSFAPERPFDDVEAFIQSVVNTCVAHPQNLPRSRFTNAQLFDYSSMPVTTGMGLINPYEDLQEINRTQAANSQISPQKKKVLRVQSSEWLRRMNTKLDVDPRCK
jgi:hypothetical protein